MPNSPTSTPRVWLSREPAGWHDVVVVELGPLFVAQLLPGYGTLNGKGPTVAEAVRRLQLEVERLEELLDEAARQSLARKPS